MKTKELVIADLRKLYSNPIAELVQAAWNFDSEIYFMDETRKINLKSIMGVMALNPCSGMSVRLVTNGKDEKEASEALEKFLICQ